jgi:probable phosphoglycerate mutase
VTKIYLIRHAEAEGNLYRRGQGQYDGAVTPRGYLQIKALAEHFRNIHIDAVFSSDLSRTIDTAGAITKSRGLELQIIPGLRELNMGAWEDVPWGNLEFDQPEQMQNFNSDLTNWIIDGAESIKELTERITATVKEIANGHGDKTIAIVSHGMAIRALLCVYSGLGLGQISEISHPDNTAVSLLEYDGSGFKIIFTSDNSHLTDEISTFAKQGWEEDEGGVKLKNLRFVPLDLKAERDFYISCYADTWIVSNGSLNGFDAEYCYARALEHCRDYPEALMKAMIGDKDAGIIELNPKRGELQGYGWITLCYMMPEFQSQGLGVQLIGHAVSFYRSLDRTSIRLHVTEKNTRAVSFYERYGFAPIGFEMTPRSKLILMEKENSQAVSNMIKATSLM